MPPDNKDCSDCISTLKTLTTRVSKVEDAILSISESLRTLAVVESNSERFENSINGLRDKIQLMDKTIASRPSMQNIEKVDEKINKLFSKIDAVDSKVTTLEASRNTLTWVFGILVTLAAAYIATL